MCQLDVKYVMNSLCYYDNLDVKCAEYNKGQMFCGRGDFVNAQTWKVSLLDIYMVSGVAWRKKLAKRKNSLFKVRYYLREKLFYLYVPIGFLNTARISLSWLLLSINFKKKIVILFIWIVLFNQGVQKGGKKVFRKQSSEIRPVVFSNRLKYMRFFPCMMIIKFDHHYPASDWSLVKMQSLQGSWSLSRPVTQIPPLGT